jgi:hypothetical protein
MSEIAPETVLTIRLEPAEIAAIDAWIARHDDPKPSREDAVRQLVAGRLGVEQGHSSTVIPSIVTGRDIV